MARCGHYLPRDGGSVRKLVADVHNDFEAVWADGKPWLELRRGVTWRRRRLVLPERFTDGPSRWLASMMQRIDAQYRGPRRIFDG